MTHPQLKLSFSTYVMMFVSALLAGLGAYWHWDVLIVNKYNEDMYSVLGISYLITIYFGGALLSWITGQQLSKQFVRANRVKLAATQGAGSIFKSIRSAFTGKTYDKREYKNSRPMNLYFYRAPAIIAVIVLAGAAAYLSFFMVSNFFWGNPSTVLEVFLWDAGLVLATLGGILALSFLGYKFTIRKAPRNWTP